MKKLLTFEEIRRYLIDDAHVRDEIARTFKSDTPTILTLLARGEELQLPNADVDTFLIDLLHNYGRIYKRYTAHERFSASKEQTLWYYENLAQIFESRGTPVARALRGTVNEMKRLAV